MPVAKPISYNDMLSAMEDAMSAHDKVVAGIATHTEKEMAAREQRHHELERKQSQAKLTEVQNAKL